MPDDANLDRRLNDLEADHLNRHLAALAGSVNELWAGLDEAARRITTLEKELAAERDVRVSAEFREREKARKVPVHAEPPPQVFRAEAAHPEALVALVLLAALAGRPAAPPHRFPNLVADALSLADAFFAALEGREAPTQPEE